MSVTSDEEKLPERYKHLCSNDDLQLPGLHAKCGLAHGSRDKTLRSLVSIAQLLEPRRVPTHSEHIKEASSQTNCSVCKDLDEQLSTASDPDRPQLLPLPARPASSYDPKPVPVTPLSLGERLLTDVRYGMPITSARSARALALKSPEEASSVIPKLIELAEHSSHPQTHRVDDAHVRRSAILALGNIGAAAQASLDRLLERLKLEDDDDTRGAIARTIGKIIVAKPDASKSEAPNHSEADSQPVQQAVGIAPAAKSDAVVALSSIAQDESAPLVVRANAVCALGNRALGEKSSLATMALAKLATGSDVLLRQEALRSLRLMRTTALATDDVVSVLIGAMQHVGDDDAILWPSARCALVCLGAGSIPALTGLLLADDRGVRGRAMRALEELQIQVDSIPATLIHELTGLVQSEASSSSDTALRLRSANLLKKIAGVVGNSAKEIPAALDAALTQTAAPALLQALLSHIADECSKEVFTSALQAFGVRAIPGLTEEPPDTDLSTRMLMLDLVKSIVRVSPSAVPTKHMVSLMIKDSEVAVRIAAIKIFAETGESLPTEGASALVACLEHKEPQVPELAAEVLRHGGQAAAVAVLAGLVDAPDGSSMQSTCADILVDIGKPALSVLARFLDSSEKDAPRAKVAKVLGRMGILADEVTPALVNALKHQGLRNSAAEALLAIGSVPALAALLSAKDTVVKKTDILHALEIAAGHEAAAPPPLPTEQAVQSFFLMLETAHNVSQLASRTWRSRNDDNEEGAKRCSLWSIFSRKKDRKQTSEELQETGAIQTVRLYRLFYIPPWSTNFWFDYCAPGDAGDGAHRLKQRMKARGAEMDGVSTWFGHTDLYLDRVEHAAASCSPALADLLADDDVSVRRSAARVLCRLPAASVPAVCALRDVLLHETDQDVLMCAGTALLNLGVMSFALLNDAMLAHLSALPGNKAMIPGIYFNRSSCHEAWQALVDSMAVGPPQASALQAASAIAFNEPPPLPPGYVEQDLPTLQLDTGFGEVGLPPPPPPGGLEEDHRDCLEEDYAESGFPMAGPPLMLGLPQTSTSPGGSPLGTPRGFPMAGLPPMLGSAAGTPRRFPMVGPPPMPGSAAGTPREFPMVGPPPIPGLLQTSTSPGGSPAGTPRRFPMAGPPSRPGSAAATPRRFPMAGPPPMPGSAAGTPRAFRMSGPPSRPGSAAATPRGFPMAGPPPPRMRVATPGGSASGTPRGFRRSRPPSMPGSAAGTPRGFPMAGPPPPGPPPMTPGGSQAGTPRGFPMLGEATPLGTPPAGLSLPGMLSFDPCGALEDDQRWKAFEPKLLLSRGEPMDLTRRRRSADILPPQSFSQSKRSAPLLVSSNSKRFGLQRW